MTQEKKWIIKLEEKIVEQRSFDVFQVCLEDLLYVSS